MNATAPAPSATSHIKNYWPELGQAQPSADAEIRGSYSGKSRVWTRRELSGRGVKRLRVLRAEDLVPQARHKAGMIEYEITDRALEKLNGTLTLSREILLD